MLELNKLYNMDCMQGMKEFPDGFFDLAIVDPPYGIGIDGQKKRVCGNPKHNRKEHIRKSWDKTIPPPEYFRELERVSKAQAIWGGNYFDLPPCRCFIAWHKTNIPEEFTMSNVEYAWTSFNENAKLWHGSSARSKNESHFHPTEKPQALYAWIFHKFSKPGDKILDTHLGSGTSRKAAWDAGLDFTGFEVDSEYFLKQEEAFQEYANQTTLF